MVEKKIDIIQEYEIKDLKKEIDDLREDIRSFENMIRPLIETYKTAEMMGKWLFAFLVFISILFGVILTIRQLWK